MEKWWGEFLTPHKEPKDPEMSSTISMGYNTTGTSTYTLVTMDHRVRTKRI